MPVYNCRFIDDKTKEPAPQHLQLVGPRVPVEIKVPDAVVQELTKRQLPIPQPVSGYALIDTGASVLCVDHGVLTTSLKLSPFSSAKVGTPAGEVEQGIFPVALSFPGTGIGELSLARCLGADLDSQRKATNIIALIGRDVLINCVFIYNGKGGVYTLAY